MTGPDDVERDDWDPRDWDLAAQLGPVPYPWRFEARCCTAHPDWHVTAEGRATRPQPPNGWRVARLPFGPIVGQRVRFLWGDGWEDGAGVVDSQTIAHARSGDRACDRWDAGTGYYRRSLSATAAAMTETHARRLARMARHAFDGLIGVSGRPVGRAVSCSEIVGTIIRLTREWQRAPTQAEVADAVHYADPRGLQKALWGSWQQAIADAARWLGDEIDIVQQSNGVIVVTASVRLGLVHLDEYRVPDGTVIQVAEPTLDGLRRSHMLLWAAAHPALPK